MTGADAGELVAILRRAATVIREVYAEPFSVAYKGPGDPVTVADLRANELICEALSKSFPGVPLVAEESEAADFAGYRQAATIFFVDPLDGTREFVRRSGDFVSMIGLLEGDVATLGALVEPITDVAYWGGPGLGAWRAEKGRGAQAIRTSGTRTPAQARLVASCTDPSELAERLVEICGVASARPLGSAGCKGAAVAVGTADAYVTPFYGGKRWDACAIDALITGAGGRFSDAEGAPVDYRGPELSNDRGLLGTNGHLHDFLSARLRQLRAGR